jgi:hypothetical protein
MPATQPGCIPGGSSPGGPGLQQQKKGAVQGWLMISKASECVCVRATVNDRLPNRWQTLHRLAPRCDARLMPCDTVRALHRPSRCRRQRIALGAAWWPCRQTGSSTSQAAQRPSPAFSTWGNMPCGGYTDELWLFASPRPQLAW